VTRAGAAAGLLQIYDIGLRLTALGIVLRYLVLDFRPLVCTKSSSTGWSAVSRTSPGRTGCASLGGTPYTPIRGLPRAWAALGFQDPLGGATGPRREGLM